MREIKFRAWDKEKKEMREVRDIAWDAHGGIDVGYSYDPMNEYRGGSDTLMQFTGLLDVEGKEIYEGDVVKTPKYIIGSEPAYYENHEVVFDRGIFGLKPTHHITPLAETESGVKESKDYISNYGEIYRRYRPEVEVIGNIYENPELLK